MTIEGWGKNIPWGQFSWGTGGLSSYRKAAMAISKTSTTLIKITIDTVAGSSQVAQDFLFSEKDKPLHIENPTTALPYLHSDITFGQEIQQSVTLIGSVDIVFFDDEESNGSFWLKWKAKNKFYKNRKIEILKGFEGFAESSYIVVFKGTIQNIRTRKDGKIVVEAKSLLRITDNKVPQATDGELGADPGSTGTTITLKSGTSMSQYEDPVASGLLTYAKVQTEKFAEVFQYTGISGTSFTGCTRGLFQIDGFTAGASYPTVLDESIVVHQVRVFNNLNPIDIMLSLLGEAGLDSTPITGDIDNLPAGSFIKIRDDWFPGRLVRGIIDFPVPVKQLLKELREMTMTSLFQNSAQQIQLAFLTAPPIGTNPTRITDDNIIFKSSNTDDVFSNQITRMVFLFNLRGGEDGSEDNHYTNKITIKSSQKEQDYIQVREKKIRSRWIKSDLSGKVDTRIITKNYLRIFGDGQQTIMFSMETKDDGLEVGDLFLLTTSHLLDSSGNGLVDVKFFVIKKEQQLGSNRFDYVAYNARLTLPVGFIAPASQPVFTLATVEEKDYGYISNSSGLMSDGSTGYFII